MGRGVGGFRRRVGSTCLASVQNCILLHDADGLITCKAHHRTAQPALIIRCGNCRCGGKRTRRSNRWHVAHSADLVADGGGDGWVCSSIVCSVPLRALKMGLDAKLCVLYFNHISNLLEAFSELRCIRQPHTFVSLSSGCGE